MIVAWQSKPQGERLAATEAAARSASSAAGEQLRSGPVKVTGTNDCDIKEL